MWVLILHLCGAVETAALSIRGCTQLAGKPAVARGHTGGGEATEGHRAPPHDFPLPTSSSSCAQTA